MDEKKAGLRIRVQADLRERFVRLCRSQDRPAAQVIRDFMRQYIERHEVAGKTSSSPPEGARIRKKKIARD